MLLAGEPGVGKTRTAAEVARSAFTEGALVLFGRCDEGLGVPYQPFVEALSQGLGPYFKEIAFPPGVPKPMYVLITPIELASTLVVSLPTDEASAKIRTGPPLPEAAADAALPYWSGVIRLVTTRSVDPDPA